jgi:hypothetical protein
VDRAIHNGCFDIRHDRLRCERRVRNGTIQGGSDWIHPARFDNSDGGGTIRDLLLERPVAWVESPQELTLCVVVSLVTYFFLPSRQGQTKLMTALVGAAVFVGLSSGGMRMPLAMLAGFVATLGFRASAIRFRLQLGEPGQLLRVAERDGAN